MKESPAATAHDCDTALQSQLSESKPPSSTKSLIICRICATDEIRGFAGYSLVCKGISRPHTLVTALVPPSAAMCSLTFSPCLKICAAHSFQW